MEESDRGFVPFPGNLKVQLQIADIDPPWTEYVIPGEMKMRSEAGEERTVALEGHDDSFVEVLYGKLAEDIVGTMVARLEQGEGGVFFGGGDGTSWLDIQDMLQKLPGRPYEDLVSHRRAEPGQPIPGSSGSPQDDPRNVTLHRARPRRSPAVGGLDGSVQRAPVVGRLQLPSRQRCQRSQRGRQVQREGREGDEGLRRSFSAPSRGQREAAPAPAGMGVAREAEALSVG